MPSAEVGEGATGTANTEAAREIAGTCVDRKSPVRTSQSDVKGSTGNEFSRWSIEVVNSHSGPVLAKILKIVRGECEPTQARTRFGGR